jgi:4-amino-4-deoxy-L-arabinose transferase-like glycosyltransferase
MSRSAPEEGIALRRRFRAAVLVLLVLHAGLLAWGASRHSPTIDEVGHFPAGLRHWQEGRFDLYRVNPPLVRMVATLPVLAERPVTEWHRYLPDYKSRQEFTVGRQFIARNGERSFWYFTIARWACIPFSLLGGFICWRWAGELFGQAAGLLALALWCFCPNVLGNAQMITPDTGATALGVAAHYCFWRWLKQPDWRGALLAGVVLGLAELTKTTWILLFGLWPVLWVVWRWPERRALERRAWLRQCGQLSVVLLLGLYLINVGYGFEGSFEPLSSFSFKSKTLSGRPDSDASPTSPSPSNRFVGTFLGSLPVPVPRAYLLGIDQQKAEFESGFLSYLGGEWRHGGWWYYYLYGLAVKVPLGTWVMALLALLLALGRPSFRASWRDELFLLTPMVLVLTLVSSQTGFNHHLRYTLPAFPYAFILMSRVALLVTQGAKVLLALAGTALAWSVASSLMIYPHSLSYFNELVGGPEQGSAHLVDSNLDWGQDLLYLRDWLESHPEARPFGLVYFGGFDPRVAGIKFTLPPFGPVVAADTVGPDAAALGPQPGWYAVSATLLRGYQFAVADGRGGSRYLDRPYYSYFQLLQPVARAGYSINIYHVTAEDADRVREELGLPRLPSQSDDSRPPALTPRARADVIVPSSDPRR